jgi:UDP-N-acetylmuramoylalanine--D-glutamate ligase
MSVDTDLASPLVVGFGVVGRAVARALLNRGLHPVVIEDRPSEATERAAAEIGIELVGAPSSERLDELVARATVLLPSPGVPDHHSVFERARRAGVPVRSEFDLARLWDDRPLVAITGTNGKTSVTMIVTDALERSGRTTAAVGNTEVPLVSAIDDPQIEIFVVEASSFRLGHTSSFHPLVATWLNFAPDHLDAHASLTSYEEAKASIWADLAPGGVVIANADDPVVCRHLPMGPTTMRFSATDPAADWHVAAGALVGPTGALVEIADLARSQPHDIENALAVAATATAAGAEPAAVAEALRSFRGLPHRLALVGEWEGVRWYNDSKATVPQATEAAVGGFAAVVLIAGGRNKGLALDGLGRLVPPVHHVVAIGEAAAEIEAVFASSVPVTVASSMIEAVRDAQRVARSGDVVLLSPGCTSFDWYGSYVERGADFERLVLQEVGS